MAVLTADQITHITTAIDSAQDYIDKLQAALGAAATAGNTAAATTIEGYYDDALTLEASLKALLTISVAASLQPAIDAINNGPVATLKNQQATIDNAVAAVGIAATVVGDIASIASALGAI